MENTLTGKVAIVTGGARGIGRAIALRLGQMGASVCVNYGHSQDQAAEVVQELAKAGTQAVAIQADMRKVAQIRQLFEASTKNFGRLDILINNAGMLQNKPVMDMDEASYDELMDLNLKSVFFACQEAAKIMAEGGRIINITSTVTRMLLPTYGAYAASKGAVDQLTRVLAKELGSRQITVNSLSPGPVDTPLFRKGKSEDQIVQMAAMAALGRIGAPNDIADAVSLLVRDEAGWISGQLIGANGGMA